MPQVDLRDFSGGLNLRDSLEALAPRETPDALNMTLTTRGAVIVRNGCTQAVTLPAGNAIFLYYSPVLDKWLLQVDTTIYWRPGDLSGAWTSLGTWGSAGTMACVDFQTNVVITHPVSGTHYWDGVGPGLGLASATAKGSCIAVFKNRVWIGGDPAQKSRLWFSNLGVGSVYTTASDFVDVREKDAKIITAFGSAQSGGLLVYKKNSAYRITDASTGAYTTIDWDSGCVGEQAVVSLRGLTYTWGTNGIYAWDGVGKGINVADKIRPRFIDNTATAAALAKVCAGVQRDRIVFAYPLNAAVNNRIVEMRASDPTRSDELPGSAWIMEHTLAQSGEDEIVSFSAKETALYAALTDGDVLYSMFDASPGADDGTNFTANYKTPPLTLGLLARLQRARVYGKADAAGTSTKELRTYKDWSPSVADTFDITSSIESADGEEKIDLRPLGHADAFQLEFRATGGTGSAELDRLLLDLTPLER
jgi:hypothetical protein